MKEEFRNKINSFLKIKNIAIAGYSTHKSQPANYIYKNFLANGYNVFAVNPKNNLIKDVKCYNSLKAISHPLDGVVICTPSIVTPSIVRECISLGIEYIWIHKTFDEGSYSHHAYELCRQNNINCIASGCPNMFLKPDIPHKCLKWAMDIGGKFKYC